MRAVLVARLSSARRSIAAALVVLAFVSCGKKKDQGAAPPPGPVEVGVVTLVPKDVTLTTELPGRTSAYRVAEVRARVSGIVLKRHFQEGAEVKEGDPLFDIDPAPFEAVRDAAKGRLARTYATLSNANIQARRAERMFKGGVGTQQDWDNAVAALNVAQADVTAAQADLKAAEINVDFTKVKSPIAGTIGRAEVTEGAYVQSNPASLMATVQQLDPMFVDLTWASTEVSRLRSEIEAGKLTGESETRVMISLADGMPYPLPGTLQFTDVTVDPGTGALALRALFKNPDKKLFARMFVRARVEEGARKDAILVPQRGVTRDPRGKAVALVVNADDKVERREVVTERALGDEWLVLEGLKAGDRVIVEGLQKVKPDTPVVAVPAEEKHAAR